GEDASGESVPDTVRDPQRVMLVAEGHHREDGAEDLLLREATVRCDVVEECGAHEETVAQTVLDETTAAGDEPCAVRQSEIDVIEHLTQLRLVDDRPTVVRRVGRVADLERLDPG